MKVLILLLFLSITMSLVESREDRRRYDFSQNSPVQHRSLMPFPILSKRQVEHREPIGKSVKRRIKRRGGRFGQAAQSPKRGFAKLSRRNGMRRHRKYSERQEMLDGAMRDEMTDFSTNRRSKFGLRSRLQQRSHMKRKHKHQVQQLRNNNKLESARFDIDGAEKYLNTPRA